MHLCPFWCGLAWQYMLALNMLQVLDGCNSNSGFHTFPITTPAPTVYTVYYFLYLIASVNPQKSHSPTALSLTFFISMTSLKLSLWLPGFLLHSHLQSQMYYKKSVNILTVNSCLLLLCFPAHICLI